MYVVPSEKDDDTRLSFGQAVRMFILSDIAILRMRDHKQWAATVRRALRLSICRADAAQLLQVDARTLRRYCIELGIKAAKRGPGKKVT